MKKIYCKKCGNKILDSDADYCPRCGARINDYAEVQQMQKSKRTRNIILILLAITVVAAILIIAGAVTTNNNNHGFTTYNFSSSCSVELPNWISFNDGAGDINSNSNIAGSSVSSVTKALFGNSEVMQITYSKSVVDGQSVGMNLDDSINVNTNGKQVYTRIVMSEETGESVSVMGENQTLVNYIADHVKFNGKNANNTNNTTQNDNQKKALAYKSDGTPMYTQAEVDQYMLTKYGMVDYHIQDNGYISLDEPGYTSDGHRSYSYDYGSSQGSSSQGSSSQESSGGSSVITTEA